MPSIRESVCRGGEPSRRTVWTGLNQYPTPTTRIWAGKIESMCGHRYLGSDFLDPVIAAGPFAQRAESDRPRT